DLSSNNFEGHLPQCLNHLTHLKVLDIFNNQLSGNFPSTLTNFTSLEYLDLSSINFQGTFSINSLANHSKLEVLLLSSGSNMLQVKTESWHPTSQLKVLKLSDCQLHVIPSFLLQQDHLKFLDLSHNKLVGNFPICGKMDDGLRSSTSLEGLDISGNIPNWIGNISTLRVLLMSKNYLEANIPVQLNHLKSLELIDIFENSLSSKLITLDLRDNKFFGRIPYQINELSNLHVLLLRGNSLQGHIPNELCQLAKLRIMDLSNNIFSGSIPSCLGNVSFWRE
ncbi:hypothetical protein CISIN_1g044855mg, partial [Citrus sinensis]